MACFHKLSAIAPAVVQSSGNHDLPGAHPLAIRTKIANDVNNAGDGHR